MNPATDLGFFSSGLWAFPKTTCNRMMHTLPSSFLFPIIINHCQEMGKIKIQREVGKGPLKNPLGKICINLIVAAFLGFNKNFNSPGLRADNRASAGKVASSDPVGLGIFRILSYSGI